MEEKLDEINQKLDYIKKQLTGIDFENKVYVLSYWDEDATEPTVTVFNDYEIGSKALDYFSKWHEGCILDTCDVYSYFAIMKEKEV